MNKCCEGCSKINYCPFARQFLTNFKPVCYQEEFHNYQTNTSNNVNFKIEKEEYIKLNHLTEFGFRVIDGNGVEGYGDIHFPTKQSAVNFLKDLIKVCKQDLKELEVK